MRMHSDVLTSHATYAATSDLPNVYADVSAHGSRLRARAFEVALEGTSSRPRNSGKYGATSERAATWDEWGMFLAALYRLDPDMFCGSKSYPVYRNAADFHAQTGDRFHTLTPESQHRNHRWAWSENGSTCACGAMRHTGGSMAGAA